MTVCVDASVIVKLLTPESGSTEALSWLASHAGEQFLAPASLPAEVGSALRTKMRRAEMSVAQCTEALGLLNRLAIQYTWDWDLLERAFNLAVELDQPTVYDTLYLALAEKQQCELWTADMGFVRAASPGYPFVKALTSDS
jgi:predicted nucleic acid-binding protein